MANIGLDHLGYIEKNRQMPQLCKFDSFYNIALVFHYYVSVSKWFFKPKGLSFLVSNKEEKTGQWKATQ